MAVVMNPGDFGLRYGLCFCALGIDDANLLRADKQVSALTSSLSLHLRMKRGY